MEKLNFLLSNYSIGEIFVFLIVIVFLSIIFLKIWDYIWEKIRIYFNIQNKKDKYEKDTTTKIENILEQLENIQFSIDHLQEQSEQKYKQLKNIEK